MLVGSGPWLTSSPSNQTYFLQMGGVNDPFKIQIILILMGLIGTMLGMYLMFKHLGRRSMMLIGVGLSALFMLASGISYSTTNGKGVGGKLIVVFVSLFVFSNNAFSGALSWPLAAELVSSRLRVHTFSFATIINYFFACKLTPPGETRAKLRCRLPPSLRRNFTSTDRWLKLRAHLVLHAVLYQSSCPRLGWEVLLHLGSVQRCHLHLFLVCEFSPPCCIAAPKATMALQGYLANFGRLQLLPEIKGRTLEEIDELFEQRVPLKDFPKYHCRSSDRAKELARADEKVREEQVEAVEKV